MVQKRKSTKKSRVSDEEFGKGCCLLTVLAMLAFGLYLLGTSLESDDSAPDDQQAQSEVQFDTRFSQEPGGDQAYKVISIDEPRSRGDKCVTINVLINASKLSFGDTEAPSLGMFKLTDGNGVTTPLIDATVTVGDYVSGSQVKSGQIEFCMGYADGGDRVVLAHGKRSWKFTIPKEKKAKVNPPDDDSDSGGSDGDDSSDSGGGSINPPGYTGKRCYAPGGRTWHPC